jgi:hypothetical protein
LENTLSNESNQLDPTCPIEWSHPLNRGLVAEWAVTPLSGWRGGNTLRDLVRGAKNPHDGTLTGGPTWSSQSPPGRSGSISLASSSQFVDCGTSSALSFERTQPFSIVALLRTTSTAAGLVASKNLGSGAFTGWGWIANQDNSGGTNPGIGRLFLLGTGIITAQYSFPNDGKWHLLVVTYDGSSAIGGIKFYQDGSPLSVTATQGSTISGSILTSHKFTWGALDISTTGLVCNLTSGLAFNTQLSASQVAALYAESKAGNPNRWRWMTQTAYSFGAAAAPTGGGQNLLGDGCMMGANLLGNGTLVAA